MAPLVASRALRACPVGPSFSGRVAVAAPAGRRGLAMTRAVPAPATAGSPESPDYCVLDLQGHPQFVEVGSMFATSQAFLQGQAKSLPGGTIRFNRVLAAKVEAEFMQGEPFVEQVAVEAQLVDEFAGPAMADEAPRVVQLLVTKITKTASGSADSVPPAVLRELVSS